MSSPQPHDDATTTGEAGGSAPSAGSPVVLTSEELTAIVQGAVSLQAEAMKCDPSDSAKHYMMTHRDTLMALYGRAT